MREQAGGGLGEGAGRGPGLCAVRRRRKGKGHRRGRPGQGGCVGEAEGADRGQTPVRSAGDRRQGPGRGAARPALPACSGLKSRGSHSGGEGGRRLAPMSGQENTGELLLKAALLRPPPRHPTSPDSQGRLYSRWNSVNCHQPEVTWQKERGLRQLLPGTPEVLQGLEWGCWPAHPPPRSLAAVAWLRAHREGASRTLSVMACAVPGVWEG